MQVLTSTNLQELARTCENYKKKLLQEIFKVAQFSIEKQSEMVYCFYGAH